MTDERRRARAQGQLRADRDADDGRDAGGGDARRPRALHPSPRGGAKARPRARGAARRRGARRAQVRRPRPDPARARHPDRLHRRSTSTASCWTPTCPEDPYLSAELEAYFPAPLPERYAERMDCTPAAARDHRHAGRQPHARTAAGPRSRSGSTRRRARRRRRSRARTRSRARSSRCARSGARSRRSTTPVAAETQTAMLLEGRRLIERGTRWLLRNRRRPLDIAATVAHFAPGAAALYESVSRLLDPHEAATLGRKADELQRAGVPRDLAMRVALAADHVRGARHRRGGDRHRPRGRARRRRALPAGQPPGAALAARPDRRAAAQRPLGRARPGRAARRPQHAAPRADGRGAALRPGRRSTPTRS